MGWVFRFFVICVVAVPFSGWGAKKDPILCQVRPWVDASGRGVEGTIRQYDASKGTILLESVNGKKAWVKPESFSDKDQKYIQSWITADTFLSDSQLEVTFDKQTKGGYSAFEVIFKNKSSRLVPGFTVDYKFYIEIESFEGKDQEKWKFGSLVVRDLAPGGEQMFKISSGLGGSKYKTVRVVTTTSSWDERRKVSTTYTRGFLLRMKGQQLGGQDVIREISEPKSLGEKFSWDDARDLETEETKRALAELRERENEAVDRSEQALEDEPVAEHKDVSVFDDDPAAVPRFKELLDAAASGDSDAMLRVAALFEKGEGTPVDYGQAIEWYTTAARSNRLDGCEGLARIYASCEDAAYHDGEKAVKFASVVVRKKPKDATALLLLSAAHMRNHDKSRAISTATKAAGQAGSQAQAKIIRDRIANYKQGMPYPLDASAQWLSTASEKGNGWATSRLAELQSDPDNSLYNLSAAHEALEKKIAAGDSMAWVELGDLYYYAKGDDLDLERAASYYEKALEKNDREDLPVRVLKYRSFKMPMRSVMYSIVYERQKDASKQDRELVLFLYELAMKKGFVSPGVIERYKKDPELFGMTREELSRRAYECFREKEYEKYILFLTKLHDVGDENAACSLAYFYIYRSEEKSLPYYDLDKGIEWFETGVAMKDEGCFRGIIQFYSLAKDKSRRDYEKAAYYADLAGESDWGNLVFAQGEAYARARQYDKAIKCFKKCIKMSREQDPDAKCDASERWLKKCYAEQKEQHVQ